MALAPGVLLGAVYQADTGPAAASGYRIGPKDLVAIRVAELPELDVERRVAEDGTVFLPLLGEIAVAGLSTEEMAARVTELLEQRYVQPGRASVEVQVREFRARPISLIGAVAQPGPLGFPGRWTLLEALTAAGGLAGGHGGIIYVLRRADNGLTDQVAIKVDDLFARADPSVNIPIYANDLINVPAASSINVYCLGEVNHPGSVTFSSTERITVLATIARAGGLTDRASSKLLIRRANQRTQVKVDYKRILSGREADVELGEGDVLIVKEAFF